MIVHAPAKINLALYVNQKRRDGFHDIETIFIRLNFGDRIVLTKSDHLKITVRPPVVPAGPENIVHRAATLLANKYDLNPNVHISIRKQIPVGGGLGGGSANAAAVVKALLTYWKIKENDKFTRQLLIELGSDVPFCFWGKTSLGRGRGEKLFPLPLFPRHHVVLVKPPFGVSTALAYGDLGRHLTPPPEKVNLYRRYCAFLKGKAPLRALMHNDFEATVFKRHPALRKIRE